ncbi:MAG: Lipid A export ATP-binding/permease protein MsbA [Firmicutes bacterium ADurb.Bin506]|nr:MAG: Lipid A export ATP-binding/permease protein MsbA [Firmicutes bacterium ADurb.Bin506]
MRNYNPPRGSVFIDGHDIMDIKLHSLRGHLGVAPQEAFLFSTNIADNITFGDDGYTREQIMAAAQTAQVLADIESFPAGLDTVVGERGVTLSGGQKQRVCIARALLREPAILLLDDCLSAVDTQTEEKILAGLRRYMSERTSIMVSHRISTVRDADHIIVLDDGRLVEEGTHESLVEAGGLYADMYEKQLLEEELEGKA